MCLLFDFWDATINFSWIIFCFIDQIRKLAPYCSSNSMYYFKYWVTIFRSSVSSLIYITSHCDSLIEVVPSLYIKLKGLMSSSHFRFHPWTLYNLLSLFRTFSCFVVMLNNCLYKGLAPIFLELFLNTLYILYFFWVDCVFQLYIVYMHNVTDFAYLSQKDSYQSWFIVFTTTFLLNNAHSNSAKITVV